MATAFVFVATLDLHAQMSATERAIVVSGQTALGRYAEFSIATDLEGGGFRATFGRWRLYLKPVVGVPIFWLIG
jgi:hypothetical protein